MDAAQIRRCVDACITERISFEKATIYYLLDALEQALGGGRPLPIDRETLGRMVREAWVRWAQTQPSPKPSWLAPYDELAEPDKEADRQIGEAIARWTLIHDAARFAVAQPASQAVMDAAEIARLRWMTKNGFWLSIIQASYLLDSLEQARKGNAALLAILEDTRVERDTALQSALIVTAQRDQAQKINEFGLRALQTVEAQRDQAQQSAKDARALLGEAVPIVPRGAYYGCLRERIEAMLEKMP